MKTFGYAAHSAGARGYAVWGRSAGARMAAAIGSQGTARFGGSNLPKPSALGHGTACCGIAQVRHDFETGEQNCSVRACVGAYECRFGGTIINQNAEV